MRPTQKRERLRISPLDNWHRGHGARMMEFAGWSLPLQFTSILSEHQAVRSRAGLFDISHMAQMLVEGGEALEWLHCIITNDLFRAADGVGTYTHLCNDAGGIIDDGYVFRLSQRRFFLVFNSSREQAVLDHLTKLLQPGVHLESVTDRGAMALQGPASAEIVGKVVPGITLPARRRIVETTVVGRHVLLSRTGYTGEDGFELFCRSEDTEALWEAIWRAGENDGLAAAGLGARDVLRLEMGYPLYGHELTEDVNPFEVGYGWAVKLEKPCSFPGRDALGRLAEHGPARKLVGLVLEDHGVPRQGNAVVQGDDVVGVVTSGTHSPMLGRGICLALVTSSASGPFSLEARGRRLRARQASPPFVQASACGAAAVTPRWGGREVLQGS